MEQQDLLNDPIVSVEPWVSSSECTNWMQNLGPERFASFPKHYFFVRVYRPLAVSTLVNYLASFGLVFFHSSIVAGTDKMV